MLIVETLTADPIVGGGPYGHPLGGHSFQRRASLHVCFVDEAGDLGVLGNPPLPNDQPVLAIAGFFVDLAHLARLTDSFLNLKHQYFPGLPYPSTLHLDRILPEIKGRISAATLHVEPQGNEGMQSASSTESSTACRGSQAPLRATVEGSPVPIPKPRERPIRGRARGLRRHPPQEWLVDVSLNGISRRIRCAAFSVARPRPA